MLTPALQEFASHFGYELEFAQHQNHYPDVTIREENENLFALDIKTAYREDENTISGMTLGTFTGYFRDRAGTKNITYPYNSYKAHLVLGVIYSRVESSLPPQIYALEQIDSLPVPLKDIEVFVQPKYRIASDKPGSGNTKNIGAVSEIDALINGKGPFADLGEKVFDDYRELRNRHTRVCRSICKSKGQETHYEVEWHRKSTSPAHKVSRNQDEVGSVYYAFYPMAGRGQMD